MNTVHLHICGKKTCHGSINAALSHARAEIIRRRFLGLIKPEFLRALRQLFGIEK